MDGGVKVMAGGGEEEGGSCEASHVMGIVPMPSRALVDDLFSSHSIYTWITTALDP